jgi:hypothetical protein
MKLVGGGVVWVAVVGGVWMRGGCAVRFRVAEAAKARARLPRFLRNKNSILNQKTPPFFHFITDDRHNI